MLNTKYSIKFKEVVQNARKSVQVWKKKSEVLHKVVKQSSTFRIQGGSKIKSENL